MTHDEWQGLAFLLDNGWPGSFDDAKSEAYFVLLRDYSADDVKRALVGLVGSGCRFAPSVSEIAGQIGQVPSFDEAWPVILDVMRQHSADGGRIVSELRGRLGDVPAGWVAAYGVRRLLLEPLEGPYGGVIVHRLREHYSGLVGSGAGRGRLVAAAGRPVLTGGGLRRLLPVAEHERVRVPPDASGTGRAA